MRACLDAAELEAGKARMYRLPAFSRLPVLRRVTASRRRCHFHAGFFFWAARNVIPNKYLTDARRAEPIDMRYLAKRATFVRVKRTSL